MGIFSSIFSSKKSEETTESKQKENQKNFDILKYDGVRALRMGRTDYAVKCFTEALHLQKDFETMHFLTTAYTMLQELEEALDVLEEMIEMEPEEVNSYLTRVNILFMLDRDAEAIAYCTQAITLDPENYLAYFLQAKAKQNTGDFLGAIADLTKAIALKEEFADGFLVRAEVLLAMKQGKEALADAEQVIALVPEEEAGYLLRGRIYELLNETASATADYHHTLTLNPFNEEAYLRAGQLLINQEKYDEAITLLDEAIEHNEHFAKAYAERGRAKHLLGDKEGAVKDLQMSIELNPEGEEAQKLGQVNFDNLYKGGIF